MRGKKPKERERYVIRLDDGALVEVNREIYLEWYQSKRRERYQKERDWKYGVCSIEKLHEKGYFPEQLIYNKDTTQEVILRKECWDSLENALKKLPRQDIRLLRLLYFKEMTVKEVARIFACNRKTILSRKQRILKILRSALVEEI